MKIQFPTTDATIRTAIRKRLAARCADDSDTFVVEELPVSRGDARLDLAVINGRIEGIEIKSSRDTLDRLSRQAAIYSEGMDRMSIFAAPNHLQEVLAQVPDWWAVYEVNKGRRGGILIRREQLGRMNPNCTSEGQLGLLEKGEIIGLLSRHGMDRGYCSATWPVLAGRAIDNLSCKQIAEGVREQLKMRILIRAKLTTTPFGRSAMGGGLSSFNRFFPELGLTLAASSAD